MTESVRQKDGIAFGVFAVAVLIVGWKISILFSETTRKLEMERFQLASPTWTSWAALAPVPSMYNFENRIQFSSEVSPRGPISRDAEVWFECPVNHYPARCMTFGEFAPTWFEHSSEGTFEMKTLFRETELVSRWTIKGQDNGSMIVQRQSKTWVDHDAD